MSIRTNGDGPSRRDAFTLVELMVSLSVIVLVMLILLQTIDQTQRIWSRTSTKISQFQAARSAFDALTRNLGQATLNTYYGVEYDEFGSPRGFHRESELHFISGKASQSNLLNGDEATYPTHAVFFQAPLGISAETSSGSDPVKVYRNLNHLLSGVGYYIEWGDDKNVPDFLRTAKSGPVPLIPERYRYRLMEIIQPAESLSIYATESVYKATQLKNTTDWIQVALGRQAPASGGAKRDSSWVRAENVIALVLLPKLPERDRTPPGSTVLDLAPKYEYDSRPNSNGRAMRKEELTTPEQKKQFNQLPPVIQVVMVAIDETSASRYQAMNGQQAPDWTEGLFQTCNKQEDLVRDLGDPANPNSNSLIYRLGHGDSPHPRVEYRIYTADVAIRGAKWTSVD